VTESRATDADASFAAQVATGARYAVAAVARHWLMLLLVFVFVLLPMWGFVAIADEVHEQERFMFDDPLLLWMHAHSSPALDRTFLVVSAFGYASGVVLIDIGLMAWLSLRRRWHDGLFFGLAVGGSALLNLAAKQLFARERPELWLSIAPEQTYSFPSGHAMGSMTLGLAVVVMCWPTRWRWLVTAIVFPLVFLVGASRVYLGVHFPSDILGAWLAATAWVLGVAVLVYRVWLRERTPAG
jgi:membrane-associated phospholipid phosphatase